MHQHLRSVVSLWVALLLAAALVLASCGDDESAADVTVSADGGTSDEPTGDGPDVEGSVEDADLLAPRDYLQGEWCDSDGQNWSIDGGTARVEDSSGGVAELPVDLAFIDNVENELVSQTDDEFVVMSAGTETTFTRGGC